MVVLESARKDEVGVGQNIVDVNVEGQSSILKAVVAACGENVHLFVCLHHLLWQYKCK